MANIIVRKPLVTTYFIPNPSAKNLHGALLFTSSILKELRFLLSWLVILHLASGYIVIMTVN